MSGYAYDYDATGTLPENVVRDEQHPISNYINKWRNIIPVFAPFYRKDLIIKVNNVRLIEGIDYYLGHKFEEASNENKLPIFGSIMLVDSELEGTLVFEQYRTLGAQFTIPVNEALTYLSKDNKDPRNCDWEDIYKYPVTVPSLNTPETLEEAVLVDTVLAEIYNYNQAKQLWITALDSAYEAFTASITALEQKLVTSEYFTHLFKTNPHNLTAEQLNAHLKTDTVATTNNVFGYNYGDFGDFIVSTDLNENSLVDIYPTEGSVSLEGNLWINEDEGLLDYSENIELFKLYEWSDSTQVSADNELTLVSNRKGFSFKAGPNLLGIAPAQDSKNKYGLIYNGYSVITSETLAEYVPPPSDLDSLVYTENSSSLSWSGVGTASNPLRATTSIPLASYTTKGKAIISSNILDKRTNIVATPLAINKVKVQLDNLVDDTITINGKPLSEDITLVKADIADTSNMDNTAPEDKVASNAFKTAVSNLADANHTHDDLELSGIPDASESEVGIAQIGTVLNDTERNKSIKYYEYYNEK